ncbi:hypothetical protein NP493_131g01010 [Ridgeia piscesae]|uniref:Uncharacterized protein n=1 Tax=Ridgeia piscesae TaxID=27915 RepID=A0AAD9UGH7_RIDPI|nr:hypothetical protein NP493_131g01010 [Ridgeia piscesae]
MAHPPSSPEQKREQHEALVSATGGGGGRSRLLQSPERRPCPRPRLPVRHGRSSHTRGEARDGNQQHRAGGERRRQRPPHEPAAGTAGRTRRRGRGPVERVDQHEASAILHALSQGVTAVARASSSVCRLLTRFRSALPTWRCATELRIARTATMRSQASATTTHPLAAAGVVTWSGWDAPLTAASASTS